MMIAVLESCGYTPESAGNAARVLDLVKTTAYDLIVTDLLMPQVDGLQVLETAKSHNPNVQVLIVTAYAAREVVTDAVKKGAAGLIEKPVDIGHFISAVREALRRSRVKGADTEPSS